MNSTFTYNRLTAEHVEIQNASIGICDSLERTETVSSSLFASLERLGGLVAAHVHDEEIILENLSQSQVDCSGLQLWKAAANDFNRLRSDWLTFLAEWTLDMIEHRRAEFGASARAVLDRLHERLRFETETFYLVAWESGAIGSGG